MRLLVVIFLVCFLVQFVACEEEGDAGDYETVPEINADDGSGEDGDDYFQDRRGKSRKSKSEKKNVKVPTPVKKPQKPVEAKPERTKEPEKTSNKNSKGIKPSKKTKKLEKEAEKPQKEISSNAKDPKKKKKGQKSAKKPNKNDGSKQKEQKASSNKPNESKKPKEFKPSEDRNKKPMPPKKSIKETAEKGKKAMSPLISKQRKKPDDSKKDEDRNSKQSDQKNRKKQKSNAKNDNRKKPRNCREVTKKDLEGWDGRGGIAKLYFGSEKYKVYCDITTDEGGWMVFQRRSDGSVDFNQKFNSFEEGFGDKKKEFWLGLKTMSQFLKRGENELRVDMTDWKGKRAYAKYESFSISNRGDGYKIRVGKYSGDAGDSLSAHNGAKFSSKDRDEDGASINCSEKYESAFWFANCFQANANGKYVGKGKKTGWGKGIVWKTWRGYQYSLKSIEMKFRPKM